jgi:tetratricopeptide (TPR) repeat protein
MKKAITLICILSFLCSVSLADTVFLKDGKSLEGKVTAQSESEVKLRTEYGTLTIPREDIEKIDIAPAKLTFKDGRTLHGEIVSESQTELKLKTKYGELTIPKSEVEDIARAKDYSARTTETAGRESQRKTQSMHEQAIALLRDKRYEESAEVYQKILQINPDDMIALYNIACAYSLMGDKEKALQYLTKSIDAGYMDFEHMEHDSDLDSIRQESQYKEIMSAKDELMKTGARKQLEKLKEQFGEGYIFDVDEARRLAFAVYGSRETLDSMKADLDSYADAQWDNLFANRPSYYITIVCPSMADFRKMVPNQNVGGFYNDAEKMLICPGSRSKTGGALRHEFTHALHAADMAARGQSHSIWVAEGLATCFESSELKDGKFHPIPNGRIAVLKNFLSRGRTVRLSSFMKYSPQQFMSNAGLCYAQARYIMFYFFDCGKLRDWYEAFCSSFDREHYGVLATEKAFDKKIAGVEKDWKEWVSKQSSPPGVAPPPGGPLLGVVTTEEEQGMMVTEVDPDSGAEKAGIQPGDIIIEIDGKEVKDQSAFVNAIREHKPGDKIKIKVIRGDETIELDATLGKRK